ncbi:hypothetical protein ACSAZK_00560 [Methanosarcina sp. Mfa9]|uniref:hypothetical protein n=1 Tax=Methanosarcina sp. Mfa9 TaxID=3439063 RepID=UPI003F83BDBA
MRNETAGCSDSFLTGSRPAWSAKNTKEPEIPAPCVRGVEWSPETGLKLKVLKFQESGNDNLQSTFAEDVQSMLKEYPAKKRILFLYSSLGKAEVIKKMFVAGAGKNQAVLYTSRNKPVLSYGKLFSYRECSGPGNAGFYVSRPEEFSGFSKILAGSGPGIRAIIDNVETASRFRVAGTESRVLYTYDLRTHGVQSIKELASLADVILIDFPGPRDLRVKEKPDLEIINCTGRFGTLRTNREYASCKQRGEESGQPARRVLLSLRFPLPVVSGMEA